MNRVIIFFLGSIIFPAILNAQRFDVDWPVGTNEYPGAGSYGNAVIRFQDDSIVVEKANLNMNFENAVGAAGDSSGNLLFFTNGCYIAGASGDTLLNGDGLNPGALHDWVCPENGYISPRGIMILPVPNNHNRYYVLHMGARFEPGQNLLLGPLYYSMVDMALNDGKGTVVSKNNVLVEGMLEPFAVTRHGNGRDWWVLVPKHNTNQYFRFIAGPDGIKEAAPLEFGTVSQCRYVGSSAFSPDGRRFARQQNCKTLVFDFDRCSGDFSNPIELNRPGYAFGGGGVAFSPSGNYLFATEQMAVLSANLETSNPQFDTLINTEAITGAGLQYMQYTPDGTQLMISILHRAKFISALQNLDVYPPVFIQKAVEFPVYSVRTLPHVPNFQLYDLAGSSCDTLGINTPVSSIAPELGKEGFSIFPNPAQDKLIIKPYQTSAMGGGVQYAIVNALGSVVQRGEALPGDSAYCIAMDLPNGVYFLHLAKSDKTFGTVRFIVSKF